MDKTVDKIHENYEKVFPADFPGVLFPSPPHNVVIVISTFQMLSANMVLGGKGVLKLKMRKWVTNRLCPQLYLKPFP